MSNEPSWTAGRMFLAAAGMTLLLLQSRVPAAEAGLNGATGSMWIDDVEMAAQ